MEGRETGIVVMSPAAAERTGGVRKPSEPQPGSSSLASNRDDVMVATESRVRGHITGCAGVADRTPSVDVLSAAALIKGKATGAAEKAAGMSGSGGVASPWRGRGVVVCEYTLEAAETRDNDELA
jgi:hypothetical protein